MKRTIIIFIILLSSSVVLFAQENATCPNIEIIGPPSASQVGETMEFSVVLDEEAKNLNLKFWWELDKGTIISGQETDKILVSTEGLSDEALTASILITKLPENCKSKFTETGIVVGPIGCVSPLDEFGELENDDVRGRIDAYIIDLQNSPDSEGYVISYGSPKDVRSRERLIRDHLKFRNFDEIRIIYRNGGKEKEIRTKFWRVPAGADVSEID